MKIESSESWTKTYGEELDEEEELEDIDEILDGEIEED